MIGTFARVLAGFVLSCLTAGLVQVLFITPPQELLNIPAQAILDRAGQTGVLALLAATHAAVFAAAFTLIAAGIGEWMRIRSVAYYLATGATIAALGFSAQYASEVAGQPTIFNPYALTAFLTSGVVAGLMYWLIAGRRAGGVETETGRAGDGIDQAVAPVPPVRTWKDRPKIIVADPIPPGSVAAKNASLAERLAEREAKAGESRKVAQQTADAAAAAMAKAAPPAPKSATSAPEAGGQGLQPAGPATMTSVPATKSASPGSVRDAVNGGEQPPKKP
jgi:hypothetical protein